MNKYLQNKNQVSICDREQNCIDATGMSADRIGIAIAIMFLLFGISALVRATSK